MTSHLTSDQLSEAAIGPLPTAMREHLEACGVCREYVERLQDDLSLFGASVRRWSNEQSQSLYPYATASFKSAWLRFPVSKLALAGGLLAAASATAVFVGTWRVPEHGQPAPAITDAALLDQVDAELSRTVPGPMEPLTKLTAETNKKNAQSGTQ